MERGPHQSASGAPSSASDAAALAAALRRVEQLEALVGDLLAERVQLRAHVATLQAQLAAVEDVRQTTHQELVALKQAPFRARRRRESASGTPRGRAVGHPGSSRTRPVRIDQHEVVPAGEHCPDCGTGFTGAGVRRTRVVEDIVIRRPTIVTEFQIERRWCPACRQYHENPVTAALPRHRFGLYLLLFVCYQKVALGLSYGKIQRELALYFGLRISQGALPQMVAEVARLFGPAYARLLSLMRQQAAIHIDETGWRIDGTNHWLWVFVNDVVALYVVSRSRGSKVPKALLGPDFDGVAVSDFFSAYSPLDVEKAKCWAHLLRDSHELAKGRQTDTEYVQFHQQLHGLFVEMGLALEAASADPQGRQQVAAEMRARLLAFATSEWRMWSCRQLAARIERHLDELLVWLSNPAVQADNNPAERALRPAVVTRKTSFGSRSKQGAQAFARLLSLIQTGERQGEDFFTTAHAALADACSQS
jgi:transposase